MPYGRGKMGNFCLGFALVIGLILLILGIITAFDSRMPSKPRYTEHTGRNPYDTEYSIRGYPEDTRDDWPPIDDTPSTSMSDNDKKYLGAIMVDKHFHGDKNWNKPWEL
jgi:hypothetical protein